MRAGSGASSPQQQVKSRTSIGKYGVPHQHHLPLQGQNIHPASSQGGMYSNYSNTN
jgi:hypothetical protein